MHPQIHPAYDLPRLKLLPLREQPAYRLAANSESCNLPELLAVIIGGPQQIEIAESLLARFANLTRLQQATLAKLLR